MSGDPDKPLIPPIPSEDQRRVWAQRNKGIDYRWSIWASAFIIGLGLGVAAYRWLPGVDVYFDYWLTLATG